MSGSGWIARLNSITSRISSYVRRETFRAPPKTSDSISSMSFSTPATTGA